MTKNYCEIGKERILALKTGGSYKQAGLMYSYREESQSCCWCVFS